MTMWEHIWHWLDAIWWEMRPKSLRDPGLDRDGWPTSAGMAVHGDRSLDDGPCEDEEDDAA